MKRVGHTHFSRAVILVVAALSMLLSPLKVFAADSGYAALVSAPIQQVRSYAGLEALAGCLAAHGRSFISNEDVVNLNWFASGNTPLGTVLISGPGSGPCPDFDWLSKTLSLWGITERRALLCELAKQDASCATDGSKQIDARITDYNHVRSVIAKRFYGGGSTNLAPYLNYVLAKETWVGACGATPYGKMSDLQSQTDRLATARQDLGHYREVSIVDEATGTVERWMYKTELNYSRSVAVVATWDEMRCDALEKMINDNADAYQQFVKRMIAAGTPIDTTGSNSNRQDPEVDKAKSACGITGVGWIVCPVMTFLADVMDNMFKFLADSFLSTDPEVFKIGSPTQKAWSVFLNYANVAFVIAFMIIIYSQITSAGISNYGVKKMLPRLIISAILVNVSYYICQAAIDLSNVLGYSIMNLFNTVASQVGSGVSLDWNSNIAAILALGAGAGLLIALGGSFLIAGLFAIAMVVLILLARKAMIILLVVISPLAFVAYLLPNTESLFNRWRKMLTTLLLVFPIISLVFGASKLASAIIYSTDKENMVVKLMALGIAAIPLFVILPLLKGAMAAVPVIGNKLQGWGNKATGRASGAGKKGLSDRYQNSTLGRYNKYRAGEKSKRNALIQAGAYSGRGGAFNPRNLRSKAVNRFNKSWVSGGFGDKTAAAGAAMADKQIEDEISAAKSTFGGKTFDEINTMAHDTKLDEVTRTAAIRHIMEKGNFNQRNALVRASKGMSSLQRNSVVSGVMSRGDSAIYGAKIGDAITRGEVGSDADIANHVAQNIADGKIKAETMVHDADATKLIADVTTSGVLYRIKDATGATTARSLSALETTAVKDAATTAESLPATASRVSQNFKDQFGRL